MNSKTSPKPIELIKPLPLISEFDFLESGIDATCDNGKLTFCEKGVE